MEIKSNSRKWFWAKKIIHKFGGEKEKSICRGENLRMFLLEAKTVKVESGSGCCMVYIPEYNESSCFICG